MDIELIGNILHLKAPEEINEGMRNLIEQNFMKIISKFLEVERISCVQSLVRDWNYFKDKFNLFFNITLLEIVTIGRIA